MLSALGSTSNGLELFSCVLGQNTMLSQCVPSPSWTAWTNFIMGDILPYNESHAGGVEMLLIWSCQETRG